jgi:quercetin dioxygenase-like cupin family protein
MTMMTSNRTSGPAAVLAVALFACGAAVAAGKAVVSPKAGIKWEDAGIPGVTKAAVDGDMAKGASHFYLKYPAGFVTPVHHHSADHYVTTVSGNLVLIADGKETALPPGSYFALTGKALHAARCEGSEDCVMFIDARGPWDVVPEKAAAGK